MTYSIEAVLFKAVVGVVNTAARAANAVLTVMYPADIGHIWEDKDDCGPAVPGRQCGTPAADPPSGGVADPAGGVPPPDAPPAGSLTWEGWAMPAALDALAEHMPDHLAYEHDFVICDCDQRCHDPAHWREHVAAEIVARIGCDPVRAALALTSLQTQ